MTTGKQPPVPPRARQVPHIHRMHGDERHDPYFWLKEREDPEVIAYLEAENTYTDKVLEPTAELQEKLFGEIKGRIKEEDASVPYRHNRYYYYYRFEEGKEYPVYCRKADLPRAAEEVMIDANAEAGEEAYYAVGGRAVSTDNRLLVYGEDRVGRRLYTLRFKDLESGRMLEDELLNTTGNAVWADDHRTVFYTEKDPDTLRAWRIRRHVLGTPAEKDAVVYEETDPTFYTGVYRSRTERFILIYSVSTLTTEFRFLPTDAPEGSFELIRERIRGVEYEPEHLGGFFYIRTNEEGAFNFKLMRTPVKSPAAQPWEEVLPHREDVLLEDVLALKDHMVLLERLKGITELRVLPKAASGRDWYIEFEEASHSVWFGPNREFDAHTLRFAYTSMTTPVSEFEIDLNTRERKLLKEAPVLGGFQKTDYESERLWATAEDGTRVPISLVYRKGFRKDGSQPVLLYAYGSYGNSIDPYFSSNRLSLLDRGFAFAIAHVRGGEEMGRRWYEDGKLFRKTNTFHDFIACAEFLIDEGIAGEDQLFAMGGSAGGLLIGAVINLRPELWKGVVAAVPFVDVVTTMLDDTIPLTTFEYDEWGNPNDEAAYRYMRSYSPYDNVEAKRYPNMLVTTGLHDSQVQYWEPAKWVARLREVKKGDELLLLHTNMEAGHGGASGRFRQFREVARNYAFLLYLAGKIDA